MTGRDIAAIRLEAGQSIPIPPPKTSDFLIPYHLKFAYQTFNKLSLSRDWVDGRPKMLDATRVKDWLSLRSIELNQWEVDLIFEGDEAWMSGIFEAVSEISEIDKVRG